MRCGCSREKCKLRGKKESKSEVPGTQINQEDKENVELRPGQVSDVTQLMKSKKIVAVQPSSPYLEEADLEISLLEPTSPSTSSIGRTG